VQPNTAWRSPRLIDGSDDAICTKVHTISIVDDDESVREATKGLVRSLGYAVATFASAEEFLSSDRVGATSCVITDVQMAGLSGLDLQERLAARGIALPVIFITAFPDERTRRRAMEGGAIEYLSKPFSDEQLVSCLDTALKNDASGK
jgi:FixJ family two-component response regulator